MTTINRRNIILMLSFVLLSLVLAACDVNEEPPIVPEDAQDGDLVGMESCTYETGDDVYAAECSTLVVFENRNAPNSRLIPLPVIRIKATGDSPAEPIFWFNGGPGSSNMRFSHPDDLSALIEDHDFVIVGYRGVDGQVVLDCPEISDALINPPGNLLSDASLESYGGAAAQCSSRLQTEGVDLAGYTMIETIDDMEAARKAMGYQRISLLGVSYGTRLEMIYEWRYPDSLHRVLMIGVNPPGSFIWEPEVIDAQIEDYARLCAQDYDCSLCTDNLTETMRQVSQNMPNNFLFVPFDEDKVKLVAFIMFSESIRAPGDPIGMYGPMAIDWWLAAANGDASGLLLASWGSDLFVPTRFTWGHLLSMGSGSNEYSDPNRDYLTELNPPDSILGAPFSLLIYGMGTGWPVQSIPEEYLQVQPSDVETLLVSGSVDFMNPPQAATNELLPYLSNGEQVILKEFGHGNTFWNSQLDARLHMLTTFYDTGEADDSFYKYQPLGFLFEKSRCNL